jgi:hypothetical protein
MILSFFWLGALSAYYTTERFTHNTLIFNAVLYWSIGVALIYFLMHEIGLSFEAALFGHWKWKRAMTHMGRVMSANSQRRRGLDGIAEEEEREEQATSPKTSVANARCVGMDKRFSASLLLDLFDDMVDEDNSSNEEEIDASELFRAMSKAGMTINLMEANILIKAADKNQNGSIDRSEWNDLVRRLFGNERA